MIICNKSHPKKVKNRPALISNCQWQGPLLKKGEHFGIRHITQNYFFLIRKIESETLCKNLLSWFCRAKNCPCKNIIKNMNQILQTRIQNQDNFPWWVEYCPGFLCWQFTRDQIKKIHFALCLWFNFYGSAIYLYI